MGKTDTAVLAQHRSGDLRHRAAQLRLSLALSLWPIIHPWGNRRSSKRFSWRLRMHQSERKRGECSWAVHQIQSSSML
jgi:hypothetical protein